MCRGVGMPSPRRQGLVEQHAKFGLLPLASQEWGNPPDKIVGDCISPIDCVGGPAGLERPETKVLAGRTTNVTDSVVVAHRYRGDYTILEADRTSRGFEPLDVKTPFAVHKTGNVGRVYPFHAVSPDATVQRLSREGVGPSGPKRTAPSEMKEG